MPSHDEEEQLKIVTFNSEEGFAECTAQFIGGFCHIFPFVVFRDTQDNQGADTKVVCAEIGGVVGEVSAVLVPGDLWGGTATNRTAHPALAPGCHHMRLQWDEESGGLLVINTPVLLRFDLEFNCKRATKNKDGQTHGEMMPHSNRIRVYRAGFQS